MRVIHELAKIHHDFVDLGDELRISEFCSIGCDPIVASFDELVDLRVHTKLKGRVRVEDYVWMSPGCKVHRAVESVTVVGRGTILGAGASIGHDCKIGRNNVIANGSVLLGYVETGDNVKIGANSTINPRRKVGSNSVIGSGSVVTKDIPENCVAYGNPCKVKKVV